MRSDLSAIRWFALCFGFAAILLPVACVDLDSAGAPAGMGTDTDTNAGNTPGGSSDGTSSTAGSNNTGGAAANPDASDPCLQVGQPASPTHESMFDALNNYRASKGLSTLAYSKVLEKAANAHAKDMFDRDFFDHDNPDGDGPADRALDAGFCRARAIGENIAWNQRSVSEVQVAWQNSPGHDANMVSTEYRYVGMGYYLSQKGPYYVQLFGDAFAR